MWVADVVLAGALILATGSSVAASVPAATAADERARDGEPRPEASSLAVLRSEMVYCQARSIDGQQRRLSEHEWAFVAGKHHVHLECNASASRVQGTAKGQGPLHVSLSITRSWLFERNLVFDPAPGRFYLIKDFIDAADLEYVWIEDADTKEIVSGKRPAVFEGPDRYSDEEIRAAVASLGTGSTLVVSYKAPKRTVKRFEVRVRNKVVVETSGNEDHRTEIPIAPGSYTVRVIVESEKEQGDYSSLLELDIEHGATRTLTVIGKPWGVSPARIK